MIVPGCVLPGRTAKPWLAIGNPKPEVRTHRIGCRVQQPGYSIPLPFPSKSALISTLPSFIVTVEVGYATPESKFPVVIWAL